ncbi:Bestrophin, RFP-TM, chloride channel-domain-containing protein, partial [Chytriomyces sp. MP71]
GNPQFERERLGAINLILAFSVSTKHLLRDEVGHNYTDLAHLLVHVPKFQPGTKNRNSDSIPIDIVVLLTEYVRCAEENAVIDGTTRALLLSYIAGLIESLTNFERIRNTPIPLAYAIHLKHILVLFLLSLPFQLPQVLGWLTVPVILIASVTLLGIEGISTEIEQPFGYDHNDLRMNEFCNELRMELYNLTRECDAGARGVDGWKLSGIVRDTEFRKRERVRRTTEFGLSDFAAKVEVEVAQVMKGT